MTRIACPARLAALRRTALLDSPPEAAFDRLVALAAMVLGAPVALMVLIEEDRQFFKAAVGLPEPLATVRQTPLSHAICTHEVETGEPLVIDDARLHPLANGNGAVTELGVASYAGAPITTRDGFALGSLCVIDREPRAWTSRDIEILTGLAAFVATEIELRHCLVGHAPVDEPLHAAAFLVDRPGQQRVADESRAANDMLQSVIDLAPQAIIAVDLEWQVTRWNRAAERLFHWTEAEVVGKPLPFIPPERLAEFRTRQNTEAQSRGAPGIETQRRRKDGTLVDVLLSTGVLREAAGQPTGYVAVLTDLTEHKALEAQLRQAQKMEAVGQLAGGIAHDFNNILTIIKAQTQFALEALPPDSPARTELDAVCHAANRAANLTRQLLAFSRKQLLKPQVLELNDTVTGLLPMFERLIGEDIEVVTRLAPSLGRVTADPAQLEQVLVNLAVNARDAMPHGGVLLIETENVELDEACAAQHGAAITPGPYVLLAVSDTGCGMDAATQARIFEPFFTTKEQGRGTGLGLPMVYGIVKQSGGYVWVYSEPDHGTRFRIYLPVIHHADSCVLPGAAPPSSPRGGSETVLVVEDEDALRQIARRILERQGYTVHVAANGTDALRVAHEQDGRIDLMVTDVVLPDMSGPALAERLGAEAPQTKVLFMSGYTDDEVLRRGLLEPGVALLGKPFTLDELARMVRRVIDGTPLGASSLAASE